MTERQDALAYYERAHSDASRDFDRTLTAVSSGALVLSIAFVHDIAPDPCATGLLITSWVLFALSLLACLVSFPLSQIASREAFIAIQKDEKPDHDTPANQGVMAANIAAGATLALGVGCLVVFASLNV